MSLLRMGTAILGRYVLMGPVGRGGVSVVYQAVDSHLGRPVALKTLAPTSAGDSWARDRVHREAMITDRLRHPSVPRVYDFGDAPMPDGTVLPYVAMELLSGVSLAGRLAGGPLPWREAVRVAATVADVLAVAHRRGVVHRDLTPVNVMMTPVGVKIIDFGVAGTMDAQTAAGRWSVRYDVPPARQVDGVADPADDVQALGVLLCQMLTGRAPGPAGGRWAGPMPRGSVPAPVLLVPELPAAVADLCRACLAPNRADRPRSASAALALWSVIAPPRPRGAPARLLPALPTLPAVPASPAVPAVPAAPHPPG